MTGQYQYFCTQRPPAPGAVPIRGCRDVRDYDERKSVDANNPLSLAWGEVWYDRMLSEDEVEQYELLPGKYKRLG